MADMEDLDLGGSDEDEADADEDNLLDGLDDLEGMSDLSDLSQGEDEDAANRPEVSAKLDTETDTEAGTERDSTEADTELELAVGAIELEPAAASVADRAAETTTERDGERQRETVAWDGKHDKQRAADEARARREAKKRSALAGQGGGSPQQEQLPGSPSSASLVGRMKTAVSAAAPEQSAEGERDELGIARDDFPGVDSQSPPPGEVPPGALASGSNSNASNANDLEGLRGAGLVGRRGNRFGQRSSRSVEELLVVDPNERSEEEVDVLHEWSRSVKGSFFDGLTSNALRKEVCRRLVGQTIRASSVICREGEIGETFYVVVSGVVSVQVKGNEVATLRTGAAFGELSLTGDTDEARKRNATVVAKSSDVLLGTLDRGTYRVLVDTGWGSDLMSLRDQSRSSTGGDSSVRPDPPPNDSMGSTTPARGGAPGGLPDLSEFRAKRPAAPRTGTAPALSVGPPPIPTGRPKRSKSGPVPPPIPKGGGDGRAEPVTKKYGKEQEEARAKQLEEEAAAAIQLRYLAEEEEEAQLQLMAEEEAAAAAEAAADAARLVREKEDAAAAEVARAAVAEQERVVAEAEAEAARVAKAREVARAREEAETVKALQEEMRRLCMDGSIDDLNDILSAAEEFAEHVPFEIEQVLERIEWLEERLSILNGLVASEDFGAVVAGIEDYDNLPGECGEVYDQLLERCEELLHRARGVLTGLLDRGSDLSTAEIDAAIESNAEYSADDDIDQLITQLLERRDQLELAAQAEAAKVSEMKAAKAAMEQEQAAATAAAEQMRVQDEQQQKQADDAAAEAKTLVAAATAMASPVASVGDTEAARAAREEEEMQLLEQMEDLAQEAIEAYLEGVDHTHPFKVMSQEPEFVKQLSATLEERVLNPGELLITKGAVGDAMFFIMEGHAEVLAELDEAPLAVLGPNSFCGEEALMLEAPRNAYVRASSQEDSEVLIVLQLSKDDLMFVLDDWPALMEIIMTPMADRKWGSLEQPKLEEESLHVVEEDVEEEESLAALEAQAQAEAEREIAEAEAAAAGAAVLQSAAMEREAAAAAETVRVESEEQEAAEAVLAELELEAVAELEEHSADIAATEVRQIAAAAVQLPQRTEERVEAGFVALESSTIANADDGGDNSLSTGSIEIPEGRPRKWLSALVPPPRVGPAAAAAFYHPPSAASLSPSSWLNNLRPLSELQAQVAQSEQNAPTGTSKTKKQ